MGNHERTVDAMEKRVHQLEDMLTTAKRNLDRALQSQLDYEAELLMEDETVLEKLGLHRVEGGKKWLDG